MTCQAPCLYDLPNEILVGLLASFSTNTLLSLVLVSRRFHSLVLRILHYRLLLAAELSDYSLILEAYHPTKKWNEPYLHCTYLGTDGLNYEYDGKGSLYEDCSGVEGRIAKLGGLYSRFRPEKPGVSGSMPQPLFAAGGAGIAGSQANLAAPSRPIYTNAGDGGEAKIMHNISLDSHELFTQFCAYASLVKRGPRRGLYMSTVKLVKSGEGVMRIWRDWLQTQACEIVQKMEETSSGVNGPPEMQDSLERCPIEGDDSIRWTDRKKNLGLRFGVREWHAGAASDSWLINDRPVSYTIELKVEELIVRTTHLMMVTEAWQEEQKQQTGKAMIFGSFVRFN